MQITQGISHDIAVARRLGSMSMAERIVMLTGIWSLVCGLSAVPSFIIAYSSGYDALGMVVGVSCFVVAYVAVGCTDAFDRRWSNNRVFRRTLLTGYVFRTLAGIAFPLGTMIDLVPGTYAVQFVGQFHFRHSGFAAAFATTLVQGCFLNLLLGSFMAVLYAVQRPFVRPQKESRGFMVIPLSRK